jgi:hypothetical protein
MMELDEVALAGAARGEHTLNRSGSEGCLNSWSAAVAVFQAAVREVSKRRWKESITLR